MVLELEEEEKRYGGEGGGVGVGGRRWVYRGSRCGVIGVTWFICITLLILRRGGGEEREREGRTLDKE